MIYGLGAKKGGSLHVLALALADLLMDALAETQEKLNLCGEHNISCDIETINIQDGNTACDRTVKGGVKYRFAIDMVDLKR